MFTLTFVRPIDLVAPLNIKGNFYNTTIIKQNNMAYQHKVVICIQDGCGYPLPIPYLYFEIGENSNSYPNPVKTEKNLSNWGWFRWVTTGIGLICCHAYVYFLFFSLPCVSFL